MKKHIALLGAFAVVAVVALTAQQPAAIKAFTGVRLVDGTDRAPIDNATILVRDGRVVAAGPAASVTIPAGAERVALAGKTVIPGLINAHGHVNSARARPRYLRGVRRHDRLQPRRRCERAGGDRRPRRAGARRRSTGPASSPSGPVLDAGHARGSARSRWPRSRR